MASHGAPRARTLCPLHQAVSVRVMRAPREMRALEAGAWRRVPRRGCDRLRPAAIGRPPCRPAQSSSSGAAPRLQRSLCLLKLVGPLCPFWVQPHLHAAVTLQQSVAFSAKGRRGVKGLVGGLRWGVVRRRAHPIARRPYCTWCSGRGRLPCASATRRRVGREKGGRERQPRWMGGGGGAGSTAQEATPPRAGAGTRTDSCAR